MVFGHDLDEFESRTSSQRLTSVATPVEYTIMVGGTPRILHSGELVFVGRPGAGQRSRYHVGLVDKVQGNLLRLSNPVFHLRNEEASGSDPLHRPYVNTTHYNPISVAAHTISTLAVGVHQIKEAVQRGPLAFHLAWINQIDEPVINLRDPSDYAARAQL